MSQLSDEMKKLIDFVDKNYEDSLPMFSREYVVRVIVAVYLISFTSYFIYSIISAVIGIEQTILALVSILITLVIGLSPVFEIKSKHIVNFNFRNLQNNKEYKELAKKENNRIKNILYALIVMKNKHPRLKLVEIAEIRQELFGENKLIDNLYQDD